MSNCLEVNVEFNGKSFPFVLCHRNLDFGDSQQYAYYWQDGRQFRQKIPGSNFKSCVDLWWECAEFQAPGDPDNQQSLVWAEIFPLINTSRGMQNVYLDAVLHAKADRTITFEKQADSRKQQNERTFQLSREERSRVFQIAHSRDMELIQELLDETLLGEQPTDEEKSKLTRAAEVWLGKGVETLHVQGRSGLKNFVNTELKHWIQKFRKVGGDNRLRLFLNAISYNSKIQFYSCFSTSWIHLIHVLGNEYELSEPSERFMKLWHNQNPEYEKNGILMPDIFRGQVLSLHPLSSIVMTDPVHFSVIGKLILHEKFSELHDSNITDDFPEYWDFVATVVVAAKEYQLSHERWKQSRSRVQYTDQARVENASISESPYSVELAFEDYASCHSICCESCGGVLQFQSHTEKEGTDDVEVLFKCRNCQNPQNIQIDYQSMSEMLLTKDGD